MQLRWTEEAANDLERIADYLVQNTPDRAQGLIQRIYDAAGSLVTLPHRGRPGKVKGTRELVLSALPYVVVYVVREDAVVVVRILHGAQQWP
jgi:toxin ParE1/3/4